MTIRYRYCEPAPDPHGRSVFSLEIDGPQHPFVPVVEESLEVPNGARPEQILEAIYLRNETESAPLRPRRFEITSMFSGCIMHLSGHGWWLCPCENAVAVLHTAQANRQLPRTTEPTQQNADRLAEFHPLRERMNARILGLRGLAASTVSHGVHRVHGNTAQFGA